ncbi:MAG TPA: ATP-binding protein [Pyrinomonadaceae bacterium]|nr:ATP-binding protein [Pyrinomonadaceae bacterium]
MPRSLFFKIFLWFVTVMVTMIAGTFAVGELLRPHPEHAPMRRPLEPLLTAVAQNAADIHERSGQPALIDYLAQVRRESDVRGFLFNDRIEELSGQRMPSQAPKMARRVFDHSHHLPESSSEGPPLNARAVIAQSGKHYVLVSEILPPAPRGYSYHPILHLLAVGLVGALFCYWLARHLTSPVTKLRAATRELAGGNLRARVSPGMGNRHDELASLGADFDLMAEKIESLIESQRRLLGDISHELRSPLTRLNVALELARQRSGVEAASALERIQHEAENLNEMIGQLLTLTRLESGAEVLPKVEFDLARLVREITDDADFEARSRNRSVVLKTVEHLTMEGTEHLLRRAIENVVRNSVNYTAENTAVSVELQMKSAEACEVAGAEESTRIAAKRCAVISVRDHGPGVPENALHEIFRPFYRVDDARDREAGGVGLGLAIAERAVRLHGGIVKAANATDGGLIVTLTIPLKPQ